MVLQPFHCRRCVFLLVLPARDDLQARRLRVQALLCALRAHAEPSERAEGARLREAGAGAVRAGSVTRPLNASARRRQMILVRRPLATSSASAARSSGARTGIAILALVCTLGTPLTSVAQQPGKAPRLCFLTFDPGT